MLPRSLRISAEQLDQIMDKGRVFHSSLFVLRVLSHQKDTRISAVSPKKITKTATSRNALRRKIYSAVRKVGTLFIVPAHLALFSKQGAERVSQAEMVADIRALFVKAGLLR
jgi:ribonuclease P protein component